MSAAPSLVTIKSLWDDCDGSALVEATIVTPLLVSLFFGVFEFSWYFYNQQLVVAGLRDAARYMTRIRTHQRQQRPLRSEGSERRSLHGRGGEHCDDRQPAAGGARE